MGKHTAEYQEAAREFDAKGRAMLAMQEEFAGKSMDAPTQEKFDALGAEALAAKKHADELKLAADIEQGIEDNSRPAAKMHHNLGGIQTLDLRTALFGEKGDTPFTKGEMKRLSLATKTLVSLGDASVGTVVAPDIRGQVPVLDLPLGARELFGSGSTSVAAMTVYVESPMTNNAAEVAKSLTSSATLPESGIAWIAAVETTKQVGHYIPVDESALKNIPWLEGQIRNRLLTGLDQKINTQLLWGLGTGVLLEGLAERDNVQTFTRSTDALIEDIKRMATKSYKASGGAMPSVAVMTPDLYDDMIFAKASGSGEYIYIALATINGPTVMGLKIVQDVAAFDPKTNGVDNVFVGSPQCGEVTDQEQGNVEVGWTGDQFIQNAATLKANASLALQVWRPAGYCMMPVDRTASIS